MRIANEEYDEYFTQNALRKIKQIQKQIEHFPYCKFFLASDLQIKMYQTLYNTYDIKYRLKVFTDESY